MHSTSSNQRKVRVVSRSYCRHHHVIARGRAAHPSTGPAPSRAAVNVRRADRTRVLLGGVASWVLLSAGTVLAWNAVFG